MGTDIHLYVEYRRHGRDTEPWISGDYLRHNPYYDPEEEYDDYRDPEFEVIHLYRDRNYWLFDTLAGGRNGSSKEMIHEPKGIPEDVCHFIRKEKERDGSDGHTHSWFTLKELKEYSKKAPLIDEEGYLLPDDIENIKDGIFPEFYRVRPTPGYVHHKWQVPNSTLENIISPLEGRGYELIQDGYGDYNEENDDKIRIVFWFDN